MDLILNFGFAWISILLAVLLTVIFILRKLMNRNETYRLLFKNLNKSLRKHHKLLGIALIATGLIHGLFSSESLFSLNLGTACWVLSLLLGINFMVRKHLKLNKSWIFYHRALTVSFITVLALHIYNVGIQAPELLISSLTETTESVDYAYADEDDTTSDTSSNNSTSGSSTSDNTDSDNTASDSTTSNSSTSDSATSAVSDTSISSLNGNLEGVILNDGVYEGEATGYQPGLIVSVEIKDNAIISIEIVDHNERKSRYYAPAIEQVPGEIIDSQSLDVDTVSGSTFTSVGIINAVKDALSQALVSGTLPADMSLPTRRGH